MSRMTTGAGAQRPLAVDARRLPRWVDGFVARHGPATVATSSTGLLLHAADGATAGLAVPVAPWTAPVADPADVAGPVFALAAEALRDRRAAAVLARRGGYAVAVVTPAAVIASKVGSRYVQGRTAAGGWSQQRFARRRANQTDDLVRTCADAAVRVLGPDGAPFDALLTGGDRGLVDRVLADPRLHRLAGLPRLPHLPVGDPRSDVVKALPEHLRSVAVTLAEPAPANHDG